MQVRVVRVVRFFGAGLAGGAGFIIDEAYLIAAIEERNWS